jgi:hypothetical protein
MFSSGESMATTVSRESWVQRTWSGLVGSFSSHSSLEYRTQRSLQTTTLKLVRVQQQLAHLQTQHNTEMIRLTRAYQDLSPEQRQALPSLLKGQLDKIEADYF